MLSQNLSLELGRNAHLNIVENIFSLSYDCLPYYLKPCILYFGLYPEDYAINHKRLTRQWIAEGFIKPEEIRTPEQVADFFKKSFLVHVHNLQLLTPNKAWELFCKKVFRSEVGGRCPPELEALSKEIVQKCKQLPLAIVAIGGLLSTKSKTLIEWKKVSQNLSLELGRNAHLTSLTKILLLSYDGLPYYLKPCILYFGLYPEDCVINHRRLIRQWIAEGFVKLEEIRTPEQVAEEYLSELIQRSLVQVSNVGFEGKVQTCQVHDLLREVMIRKMKDLSFCQCVHEDSESIVVGKTRRLSIQTQLLPRN
jgi:disease resistance protein RPM1